MSFKEKEKSGKNSCIKTRTIDQNHGVFTDPKQDLSRSDSIKPEKSYNLLLLICMTGDVAYGKLF